MEISKLLKLKLMTIKNIHYKKKLFLIYFIEQVTLNNHLIGGIIFLFLFGTFAQMLSWTQSQFIWIFGFFLPIYIIKNRFDFVFNPLLIISRMNFYLIVIILLLVFIGKRSYLFNLSIIQQEEGTQITFDAVQIASRQKYNWIILSLSTITLLFYLFWNFFRDEGKHFLKLILQQKILKDFEELPKNLYERKKRITLKTLIKNYKTNAVNILKASGVPGEIQKKLVLKYGEKGRHIKTFYKMIWSTRVIIMMLKLNRNMELLRLVFERNKYYNKENKHNNNIIVSEPSKGFNRR